MARTVKGRAREREVEKRLAMVVLIGDLYWNSFAIGLNEVPGARAFAVVAVISTDSHTYTL